MEGLLLRFIRPDMSKWILQFIDFFHRPFARWFDKQTFRYLACGGFSTTLDILIYFISYNYILHKQMVVLPVITISAHIAAFIMAFFISFPTGFLLSKYVVFSQSNLDGRIQLFRYCLLVATCILLNYIFLKLFVEKCHIYPTVSKILTTLIVATYSYLTQKNFTFKVKEALEP